MLYLIQRKGIKTMKIIKDSKTTTFVIREDGTQCVIGKIKYYYEVYVEGKNSGYKFRSLKKAIEYCEYGF